MVYPSNCCYHTNVHGSIKLQNVEGLVATDFLKFSSKSNIVKVGLGPLFSAE